MQVVEMPEHDSIRVRVARNLPEHGLRAMQAVWVAGDGVQDLIDDGSLVVIGDRQQLGRLWKVGGTVYGSKRDADRVARATGQIAVEIA